MINSLYHTYCILINVIKKFVFGLFLLQSNIQYFNCGPERNVKRSPFSNLGEIHKEWTEGPRVWRESGEAQK